MQPLERNVFLYNLHPAVAKAGLDEAGDAFRAVVDSGLARFWITGFASGLATEFNGAGSLVIRSGLGGVPYLLRLKKWEEACTLLQEVIKRDQSIETLATVLPLLRHITNVTEGTQQELENLGVLATALDVAGRTPEAEKIFRRIIDKASERGEFRTASLATGDLITVLFHAGHLEDALQLTAQKKDYTRQAGLDLNEQIGDEAQRLQVLTAMGHYQEVLGEVEKLRGQISTVRDLPRDLGTPWHTRELILQLGVAAALNLGRWETALTLNGEFVASHKSRGATAQAVAMGRLNDSSSLLALGRYTELDSLLRECRQVLEQAGDTYGLRFVFSGFARLEDKLGHHSQAISFAETALRYSYLTGRPRDCALNHSIVSDCFEHAKKQRKLDLAHRLASCIIEVQMGSGNPERDWREETPDVLRILVDLAADFAAFAPDLPPLPSSFEELCDVVDATPGVRFRELFASLPRRVGTGDEAFHLVLHFAREASVVLPKD